MPLLSDQNRMAVWADVMRTLSARGESIDVVKADLRAVVNAFDDLAEAQAPTWNAALPQPGRSALSAAQKAALFALVLQRRYEVT